MVPRSNNKNNKRCKTLRGLLHTCQLSFNWLDLTSQHRAWQKEKNSAWCKTSHTNCAKETARHIATAYCTEGKEELLPAARKRKLPPAARKRKLPPAAQEKSCLLQEKKEKLPPAARKKSCLLQHKRKAASCSTREKLPPAARKKSCLLQHKRKVATCSKKEKLPPAAKRKSCLTQRTRTK